MSDQRRPRIDRRAIMALVRRDLRMYFSNPSGYVFITLFIFLSAVAAFWQDRFFMNNLANLDQLNALFPLLLMFFIPALTMAIWSEERKLGTDELLLTLPATDLEIVLGKYLAALGIYTASLALSFSHVLVLIWLGSPDLGLMLGNYFGFWLAGAAMIAVGMVASLLTSNATIAFILGAILCSLFVMIDTAAGVLSETAGRVLAPLGIFDHFDDFARGVVSLPGVLYFVAVAGLMLYLNVMLIGRRHWPVKADGWSMGVHQTVRAVAVFVALLSLGTVLSRASLRLDVTAERLHTLSRETRTLLADLPADRPVFIQAFISPDVPEHYVQTRLNLLGFLREIDSLGGSKVEVLIQDTEPYTETARLARERFGITSRRIPHLSSARAGFVDMFLGVAFTSGAEEQVIPFFDRGLPAEYEITRSIRVVARADRRRIGVVNTEVKMFGGMDFETSRTQQSWPVVEELKKQYEVVQISAETPITEQVDALLVALPSAMPQEAMDNVRAFIEAGHPALLLVDPMPLINPSLAPAERQGANRNPFMQEAPPPPRGDAQGFLAALGVQWDPMMIRWDSYNPHPDLANLPPEFIFVGKGNGNPEPFNQNHNASRGLQEVVLLYPGSLEPLAVAGAEFTPLLTTGPMSGGFNYYQVMQRGFLGTVSLNRNLPHRADGQQRVVAAQLKGPVGEGGAGTNVIVVADLDFISDQFFQIRSMGPPNLNFDNVTFFLNCMDVLVGDDSFIALRGRRVRHRTLERVEQQTSQFIDKRAADESEAETEAQKALEEAQKRLDEKVAQVRSRTDLDAQTKEIMARNLQEVESRRFETMKTTIETGKEARIQAGKETMETQIKAIQSGIRTSAILLPPIPVLVLGVMIFFRRQRRERAGALAARRLKEE